MFNWMRNKFGKVVITGILGLIAFVFVFYGVFSPRATRGLHEGAVAGTVNRESISISEFQQELHRRMEMFSRFGGGKLTPAQLKSFGMNQRVFDDLVNRKLLLQEIRHRGMWVGPQELMDQVRKIPTFQKDGQFDIAVYKKVLEENRLAPGGFEKLVRDDLSAQKWGQYFRDRVFVSDREAQKIFRLEHEKRKVKYVVIGAEFVEKPQTKKVSEAILSLLLQGGTAADQKIQKLVKPYATQLKTSAFFSMKTGLPPDIQGAKELLKDAFAANFPLDIQQGGQPKRYLWAGKWICACVVDAEQAFEKQEAVARGRRMEELVSKKAQNFFGGWLESLRAQAKIDRNAAVVDSD